MNNNQIILDAAGLCRHYGGVAAVKDVSITAVRGKTVGIIGSNGAGKTTLFNMLTAFEPPNSGSITYYLPSGVYRTEKLPAYKLSRLGIGRTFQNLRLFCSMTVEENILAAIYSCGNTDCDVNMLLSTVGLGGNGGLPVSQLSYGQRKRAELARTLACGCTVLFLDEPAAGLATDEADELTALLAALRARLGLTIILIEHNMTMIAALCDTLYAMDGGAVIAQGTTAEVFRSRAVLKAVFGEE